AYIIQIQPFPAAWRKTPSTSWKRVHGNFLHLDYLGLSQGPAGLELDPLADFDRSNVKVYRLHPSTAQFEHEPDWADAIPFTDWAKDSNWRDIVSDLMSEIDPGVLTKLRKFSHFHWRVLEVLHEWP